jgi:nitrile hydratase
VNGIHDLGGMDGFGAIAPEADEPVFHADWEKRVFALASAIPFAVPYVDDHFRREIERTPPAAYLASGYYELWLHAIERLLIERGVLAQGELTRRAPEPAAAPRRVALQPGAVSADRVPATIAGGASTRREGGKPARFLPGDAVRARNIHPTGHTRLPRFVRGKHGVVHADHGVFVFADSNAAGAGERPQHVYCVRFRARELWGEAAADSDRLFIDLWDEHLEPV